MKGIRILILGGSGMLGAMVYDFFTSKDEFIVGVTYRNNPLSKFNMEQKSSEWKLDVLDSGYKENLKQIIKEFSPEYIINCIGIIKPYIKPNNSISVYRAIQVNSFFPHILNEICQNSETKIIQIATDCVYSGDKGNYIESDLHDCTDVYGKSKSLGEIISNNFLNIRTSIIGPELKSRLSLLEWFLSKGESDMIEGYSHHFWNGATTLQFAEYCYKVIKENNFYNLRNLNSSLHLVMNNSVSKLELLHIFKKVYNKNIIIKESNLTSPKVDRTLQSIFLDVLLSNMENSINRLFHYSQNSILFSRV
jgi:dTDP-4-dehydrorhamnose reductase